MNIHKLWLWALLWVIVALLIGLLSLPAVAAEEIRDEKIINSETASDLDLYLEQLIRYECPDCGPRFKRIDSNGRFSYGCLQFQLQTFLSMARRYSIALPEESDTDIVDHIYECDYQKRIASSMFKENEIRASYHWYTTIYKKGLGLPNEYDGKEI